MRVKLKDRNGSSERASLMVWYLALKSACSENTLFFYSLRQPFLPRDSVAIIVPALLNYSATRREPASAWNGGLIFVTLAAKRATDQTGKCNLIKEHRSVVCVCGCESVFLLWHPRTHTHTHVRTHFPDHSLAPARRRPVHTAKKGGFSRDPITSSAEMELRLTSWGLLISSKMLLVQLCPVFTYLSSSHIFF